MVRILVVDDEPDFIKLVSTMLERGGFEAASAETGQAALNSLNKEEFDLVLLDLMMPGMHGFDVCKEMEQNPRTSEIPVVVVTAKGDFDSIEEAYKCSSVKGYIAKPFDRSNLIRVVSEVLKEEGMSQPRKRRRAIKKQVYQEIFEGYPEGIALLNHENTVVKVNKAWEAITGYKEGELLGRSDMPALLKPADETGTPILISEAFKACFCDDPSSTAIFNISNKKGLNIRVVSTVFKIKSGLTIIILRNISE